MMGRMLALTVLATAGAMIASAGRAQDGGAAPADAGVPRAGRPRAHVAVTPDWLEGGARRSRSLVIALHGGSWNGRTPAQLAERLREELDAPARRAGLRLLVPVAPAQQDDETWQVPWVTPSGEAAVLSLLQQEVAAGRALPDRVSLAGHGAGATGALTLAARHPELLAAVAAWSGTPPPVWDEDGRVIALLDDPADGLWSVPVYLWTGTDDEHLDRDALALFTNRLRTAAAQRGGPGLSWEQGPGGHGYGPRGPDAGLAFLKGRRRQRRR
jgi:poly(3-hydroxybutyrate) depolymerase